MDKKIFLIIAIAIFTLAVTTQSTFATVETVNNSNSIMYKQPTKEQMRKHFEERLKLSEKQKTKAREIHKQGYEEMKPVMMQLETKKQELEMVRLSRIAEKAQQEKIHELNNEISELEKQAREIRKKNTQEFEKILNKSQKAELAVMKAEGRARFEKYHQSKTLFQGLGTPSFLIKPLIPQQHNHKNW